MEVVPPLVIVWEGVGFFPVCLGIFDLVCFSFLEICFQGNIFVPYFIEIEKCFTAVLNYCGCFRLLESWNWLRCRIEPAEKTGLLPMQPSSLCNYVGCYFPSVLVPVCLQTISLLWKQQLRTVKLQVLKLKYSLRPWGKMKFYVDLLHFRKALIFFTGFWKVWDH